MSLLNKTKKISDSNKENITPSSSFKSPITYLSSFEENSLKILNDQKESIFANAEYFTTENLNFFISKDDLTRNTIESESNSHKEKTETEKLNDILREKEMRNNLLIQNINESNFWLGNHIFSEMFENELTSSQGYNFKFKNEYVLNASLANSKGTIICNKIYNKNPSSKDEILDKDNEPNIIKYFLAYNINN